MSSVVMPSAATPLTAFAASLRLYPSAAKDRKSTRQNSSHGVQSRMPSSA